MSSLQSVSKFCYAPKFSRDGHESGQAEGQSRVLQGFLAEGLQRTSAGLGSVIIDSQPLSVALLASILFGETLTGAGYVGLVVGLLGLCLLEVTPQTVSDLLSHGKLKCRFSLRKGDYTES